VGACVAELLLAAVAATSADKDAKGGGGGGDGGRGERGPVDARVERAVTQATRGHVKDVEHGKEYWGTIFPSACFLGHRIRERIEPSSDFPLELSFNTANQIAVDLSLDQSHEGTLIVSFLS